MFFLFDLLVHLQRIRVIHFCVASGTKLCFSSVLKIILIFVSFGHCVFQPFPRDQYNSYSSVGCCIKLVIGNNNGQKINLNCVDPR